MPGSAASAPYMAGVFGQAQTWYCILIRESITSSWAKTNPSLQPVTAIIFEKPFTTTAHSGLSMKETCSPS